MIIVARSIPLPKSLIKVNNIAFNTCILLFFVYLLSKPTFLLQEEGTNLVLLFYFLKFKMVSLHRTALSKTRETLSVDHFCWIFYTLNLLIYFQKY